MPEQIQPATLDQILTGETHDFTNLFAMPRLVAMHMTMFADRSFLEGATEPTVKGVKKKVSAFIANWIFLQWQLL